MHLPKLIHDLALILAVSGAVALVFRWLKQPIVLGYILAGILVGPQITLFPTVIDIENVKVWAELGVIFLLFVLGLEFSLRKLLEVGRPALVAASCEVILMTCVGYAVGKIMGWDLMDSIFLGGILAISSTTIIIKAFDEQGMRMQSFTHLVFGILVIEDLFAVLLLALLSTIAVARTSVGEEVLKQVGFLIAFLIVVIPLGLWLLPKFFKFIRSQLNDEIRVIVSLALCLILVVWSTNAGFSPALGAFLMGALIGETSEGERVDRFLRPIRDLFGAIFFTSVGMLVDIHAISSNFVLIIIISLITIVGKIIFTAGGAIAAKQDWRTSVQAGCSLAQIGEFSFIIATLGLSLNVIRPDLYPLAVSVSLITTFATPYLIQFAASSSFLTHNFKKKSSKSAQPSFWDTHVVELEVHPDFKFSGLPLKDLQIREKYGVSLIALVRGGRKILSPGRNDTLMPYDRIVVFGADSQLSKVESFFKSERFDHAESDDIRFSLEKILVHESDLIVGKNLRESKIREKADGIVLGIERQRQRIFNPDSTLVIKAGDILWIYGDRDRLRVWSKDVQT